MKTVFHCPGCQTNQRLDLADDITNIACPACQWERTFSSDSIAEGNPKVCLICGCGDLWRQKDFPQGAGLILVAVGASLSTIAWYLVYPLLAIGILMGFALIDMLLFWLMGDVLVCYRCAARFEATPTDNANISFDHELGEKYRQEAIRLEQAVKK